MRRVASIEEVFDAFGGTSAVARLLKKGQSTASEMRRRKNIPLIYWPTLIKAALEKDIDLKEATLVRIHLASAEGTPSDDQAAPHAA